MSADNGIYILETIDPKDKDKREYRVKETTDSCVSYLAWDESIDNFASDEKKSDVEIANARQIWKECQVYHDLDEAYNVASSILMGLAICEYGICRIEIDRVF